MHKKKHTRTHHTMHINRHKQSTNREQTDMLDIDTTQKHTDSRQQLDRTKNPQTHTETDTPNTHSDTVL